MRAIPRWAASGITALVFAAAASIALSAETISHDELMQKIHAARTAADYEAIAAIYDMQAAADLKAAEEHRSMATFYKGIDPTGGTRSAFGSMAVHCSNLVDAYTRAGKENAKLAELQRKAAASAH